MLNPIACAFIVLALFCLLVVGYLWVDSMPKDRKKHKRIKNVRGMK
jgi:Na+/melibiose symporter-like transporter